MPLGIIIILNLLHLKTNTLFRPFVKIIHYFVLKEFRTGDMKDEAVYRA
jgi:hypothetical protein